MRKSMLLTLFMFILGPTSLISVKAQDLTYTAVDPCRIVDTREAGGVIAENNFRNFRVSGTLGELAVQGGKTDCLDPKAGPGLKPLAITAYVVAVPAPGSTSGVLTAYPSNLPPPGPGLGSTVNFAAGQVIGNTTTITLCDSLSCPTNGEFAILARNTNQHVVIDVQGYFYPATLGICPIRAPTRFIDPERFIDNGDDTICDTQTGLMWEKKNAADNVENLDNPNDVDNLYTWTSTVDGDNSNPDGTVFTDFLARLNNTVMYRLSDAPFAGHTDWRVPTFAELQTIVDCDFGSPCIDPIFGPMAATFYWTSTSEASNRSIAWTINFGSGTVVSQGSFKDDDHRVRAVRGGGR